MASKKDKEKDTESEVESSTETKQTKVAKKRTKSSDALSPRTDDTKSPRKKESEKREPKKEEKREIQHDSIDDLETTGIKHKFTRDQCPVTNVTVYTDRAEVTRAIELEIQTPGIQEVVVSGFNANLNPNSLRVASTEGNAIIIEVSHGVVRPEVITTPHNQLLLLPENQQLIQEELDLKAKTDEVQQSIKQTESELTWLRQYSKQQLQKKLKVEGQAQYKQANMSIQDADKFLTFFRTNLAKLTAKLHQLKKDRTELNEKKSKVTEKINLIGRKNITGEENHEVIISFAGRKPEKVILSLSYVVTGASWTPSYDIRVETEIKEGEKDSKDGKCDLVYYGVITNSTNENWKNVHICLSTAAPSLGGVPPSLPSLKLQTTPLPLTRQYIDNNNDSSESELAASLEESASDGSEDDDYDKMDKMDKLEKPKMKRRLSIEWKPSEKERKGKKTNEKGKDQAKQKPSAANVLTTEVQESATSATYHIHREATIDSDQKPHKVTIAHIALEVEFQYVVVPMKTDLAFLKAMAKNSSKYILLEGPMNVFMNNFFIASSSLTTKSPGESIRLYLGADSSIKINVKPIIKNEAVTGLLKSSKVEETTHTTVVTNYKDHKVNIAVYEQMPFTSNQDVKIKTIEPRDTKGMVDEFQIIKWEFSLEPGKEKVTTFKYAIEYPAEKTIAEIEQTGVRGELPV